jgi:S1-C subfamily serine protease
VSLLDLFLVLLFAMSAFGGYRRGAILQVLGLSGVAAGVVLGVAIAPRIGEAADDPFTRVAIVLGVVLVAAATGNLLGYLVGLRIRRRVPAGGTGPRADAAVGATISVVTMLLVTWFLALNLANGPFPTVARGIQASSIVRTMAAALPAPPPLVPQLERVADALGFPNVFIGVPSAAEPVAPPGPGRVRAAFEAAAPSTVQVLGRGCVDGYLNEGSGFVAAPSYVITNAHVIAGVGSVWVDVRTGPMEATPVMFDPSLDLAVLHVPGLTAPPLSLATEELDRGAGGAVLGYPGGGHLTSEPAAVRRLFEPVGRDIYGRGEVQRRLYELDAAVRRGNSGGPFVLPNGRVAGVIFANSVLDDRIAYAIASSQVAPLLDRAVGLTSPTGVGTCTLD